MLAAHDSLPIMDFEEPEGIVHQEVCAESGELATHRCPTVRTEVFLEDNQPTEECHLHPARGFRFGEPNRRKDKDRSHF